MPALSLAEEFPRQTFLEAGPRSGSGKNVKNRIRQLPARFRPVEGLLSPLAYEALPVAIDSEMDFC